MTQPLRVTVAGSLRGAVPFLVSTAVWIVAMLVVYGLFLLSKPAGADYGPWVHASVFVPPLIGFVAHVLSLVRTIGVGDGI